MRSVSRWVDQSALVIALSCRLVAEKSSVKGSPGVLAGARIGLKISTSALSRTHQIFLLCGLMCTETINNPGIFQTGFLVEV